MGVGGYPHDTLIPIAIAVMPMNKALREMVRV